MRRLGALRVALLVSMAISCVVFAVSAARTRTESLTCGWAESAVRCEIATDYWVGSSAVTVLDHVTGARVESSSCPPDEVCIPSFHTVLLRDGRPYETTVAAEWAVRVNEIVSAREGRFSASEFRPYFLIGLLVLLADAIVTGVAWVVFRPARREAAVA